MTWGTFEPILTCLRFSVFELEARTGQTDGTRQVMRGLQEDGRIVHRESKKQDIKRCGTGGICKYVFIANFLLSVTVREF